MKRPAVTHTCMMATVQTQGEGSAFAAGDQDDRKMAAISDNQVAPSTQENVTRHTCNSQSRTANITQNVAVATPSPRVTESVPEVRMSTPPTRFGNPVLVPPPLKEVRAPCHPGDPMLRAATQDLFSNEDEDYDSSSDSSNDNDDDTSVQIIATTGFEYENAMETSKTREPEQSCENVSDNRSTYHDTMQISDYEVSIVSNDDLG